jgi:hypothetical protein
VWMAAFDSEAQLCFSKEDRFFVRVSRNGELVPEVKQVIAVIVMHNLILATGRSSAEVGLMMIREARRRGVQHMVVTQIVIEPIHMSLPQMLEAANMGAYGEFVYNGLSARARSSNSLTTPKRFATSAWIAASSQEI